MANRSEKSETLYELLNKRGYPEAFCREVCQLLNTDFTAGRMIGYLKHYPNAPMAEIADELLGILSDRNRIIQKKQLEYNNAYYNEYLRNRMFEAEEDDEDPWLED